MSGNVFGYKYILKNIFLTWKRNLKLKMIQALFRFREAGRNVRIAHTGTMSLETDKSMVSQMVKICSPLRLMGADTLSREEMQIIAQDLKTKQNNIS